MYCLIYVFSIFVLWNAVFRLLLLAVILLYYNTDLSLSLKNANADHDLPENKMAS